MLLVNNSDKKYLLKNYLNAKRILNIIYRLAADSYKITPNLQTPPNLPKGEERVNRKCRRMPDG